MLQQSPDSVIFDASSARSGIAEFEKFVKSAVEKTPEISGEAGLVLSHFFADGAYARQVWRPKGTLIVGKIHKHSCFNFLLTGRMTIWSEAGKQDIIAPAFWVSSGGLKRVTFAHEDSLLITVHGTAETDPDKMEQELTVPDYDLLPKQTIIED